MKNNENDLGSKRKRRGPDEKLTDIQMKELAIKIKKKYKQKALTYLLLEKETGLSRNTWKRRLEDFIKELNNPILRNFENTESDEIYFPNIESIFEAYGNNKLKIINELHQFEMLFQEIYEERNKLKTELKKLEKNKEILENQTNKITSLQNEATHYKTLYEQIIVASVDVNSRNKLGLKDNLIDFNKDIQKNISLINFKEYFPEISDEDELINKSQDDMSKLKSKFDNLF